MNNLNSLTQSSPSNNSVDTSSNGDFQSSASIQPAAKLDRPTHEQRKAIAQIYTEQASIYLKERNWHRAMVACKNALEVVRDHADAYKILGDILYRQGKRADALGIYAKALALNPNYATIYANVGTLYAEQEEWHQALDYYQQAVILDPNLAGTHRNLAQVWEELGDTDKALESFCRAIDLEPTSLAPEEYFDFGKQLYQQGKIKEASILFTHGVELNPEAETELAQLVQMLEELEEWQQAVVYYHRLIALPEPEGDRHKSNLSSKPIRKLLSNSKNKVRLQAQKTVAKPTQTEIPLLPQDVSQKLLPKVNSTANTIIASPQSTYDWVSSVDLSSDIAATELKPDSAVSWNNLGSLYAQKQQWAKAIRCYEESLQLDSQFVKSYRNLARVYSHIGEHLKAALCWYEAFTLEPDLVQPEEYFNLASQFLQHQQIDKAIACLRRTIDLEPNFDNARLTLGRLLETQGKPQEAQICYEKASKN